VDCPLTLVLDGSIIVTADIATDGSQYFDYGLLPFHSPWIIHDSRSEIVGFLLTLISRMGNEGVSILFTYKDDQHLHFRRV